MALGDAYATTAEYIKVKGKRDSEDVVDLERQLVSVSRWLDLRLNQPYGFHVDAAPSVHVYGPSDQIAPIADATGLVVKTASPGVDFSGVVALVAGSDYELTPLTPRPGWPYYGIRLFNQPGLYHIDPSNYSSSDYRVQVTGLHGWPAVPSAIRDATIELTAMALRGESIFTTDRISESLDSDRSVSPQARSVFKSLYMVYSQFPVAVA